VGVALVAGPNEVVSTVAHTHPKTLLEIITHIFPASVIDAMARGEVLQIVAFSVLFAMAVSAVGEKGKPIVAVAESLMQVMFKFTNYVMMFAPIGVGAAMAHTIGTQGLGVLLNLGNLILSLYLALVIFIIVVFGKRHLLLRIPLRPVR
jgi:proton glutamate symport protein